MPLTWWLRDGAVVDEVAVVGAGGDDGELALEIDEGFEDGFFGRWAAAGFGAVAISGIGLCRRSRSRRFSGWPGRPKSRRPAQICRRDAIGEEGGERKAVFREAGLLAQAVLGDVQDSPLGRTGACCGGGGGGGGDVFEFEGDDVDVGGEVADGVQIVVRGVDLDVGDLAGGGVFIGRKRVDAVAHAARRDGEHAAQLAAAEHADGRRRGGSGSLERLFGDLARVCAARNACSFARRSGRVLARIAMASSAAFLAPAIADGERGDGNAGGHLHDREQRIHAFQRAAFDRDAEDGQDGVRGGHARAGARRRRRRR